MDTKERVKRLRKIADASRRWDGTDIPLGQELREAADTIERLERERDVLAKAYDSEKDASAQYRELAAAKSREKIDEFRRAEAAESELTTLRVRVAKMEEALEWALNNCTESDHPHYPYCRDGKWVFPYLASNAGGFGGGVADAYYDTALEAVLSAKEPAS